MINKALHSEPIRFFLSLFGSFLAAVSVNFFILPHHLYSSGLLGTCQVVCTILEKEFGFSFFTQNIAGILYFLLNIPLLALAYKTLGKKFSLWLILCTAANSFFLSILPSPNVPIVDNILTSCLVGGILSGFANGLVLTCGASTGGLDILGLYLSKKGSSFTVGKFSITYNAVLYAICLLLFDVEVALYSAICTVFSALFVDRVHQQNITVQAIIFTKTKSIEISRYIMEELHRGITSWDAKGAYTGDSGQVLCVCLSKYEIGQLQKMVHNVDPEAFVVVQEGIRVGGNFQAHLG